MKKILLFSLAYYPHVGGAEVAIKEITDRILPADFTFDMVTMRFDSTQQREEHIGNIHVYRVGFPVAGGNGLFLGLNKYLFPFCGAMKARALQQKNHYDGTWAMMANYAGFAALFFKFMHPKVPYLLTLQEGDPFEYIRGRVGPLYPLFLQVFRKANFVQTISNYLAEWAREMGYDGPLEVVPNAVNAKYFSKKYPEEELTALRALFGNNRDDKFLITASRLVKKNGVDIVIRALKLLPVNIKFLILGSGPDESDLKSLAENEGVEQRVLFLGQVDHKELPKYLQASDVFVRTARSEGFGNSYVEAMAAGIPVVATPVGGIVDFLFDPTTSPDKEPTGIFSKTEDVADTAQAIQRLLRDTTLTKRIVENAKQMVTLKYDWDLIAERMKSNVFKPLVGASHG